MRFIRRDVIPHVLLHSHQHKVGLAAESPSERERSLAHHGDQNISLMRGTPVLEQKYSLPGSQLHPRICDWDYFARPRQDHPDVRRHVIRPFTIVLEVGGVFGHEPVEEFLEIAARGRIRVLHHDETATGVLNEHGQRASNDATAAQDFGNLVCNFIGPFAASADGERLGVDAQRGHLILHASACDPLRNQRDDR